MKAQHSTTPCKVFIHPVVSNPNRIFEVRRLARDGDCEFKTAPRALTHRPATQGPWGGGSAA
jgi:hypothetical protein